MVIEMTSLVLRSSDRLPLSAEEGLPREIPVRLCNFVDVPRGFI